MNPTNPSSTPVGGTPPPVSPPTTPPVGTPSPSTPPPSSPPPSSPPPSNVAGGKRSGGMFDFLHSSKKYLALAAIVVLAVAVPVTTYLAGQQQDIRQEAANDSVISASPTSCTIPVGASTCTVSIHWNDRDRDKNARVVMVPGGEFAKADRGTKNAAIAAPGASFQLYSKGKMIRSVYVAAVKAPTPTVRVVTQVPTVTKVPTATLTPTPTSIITVTGPVPSVSSTVTTTVSPSPSITAYPTTPAPTTVSPDGTEFDVSVFLQGIGRGGDNASTGGGNPDPYQLQRPVTVEIYNTSNVKAATAKGVLQYDDGLGDFAGVIEPDKALPAGAYTARIIVPGYLAQNVTSYFQVTPGATINIPPGASGIYLVTGDVNQDNMLSILDYNILLGCYSGTAPAKDCDTLRKRLSDLNDDGAVNGLDYNLFVRTLSIQRGSQGAGVGAGAPPPTTPTPSVTGAPSPSSSPTGTSPVTNVKVSALPTTSTPTSCPTTINFAADITVSSATSVSYRWLRSDGATTATQTLTFTAPGTQKIATSWVLGANNNTIFKPFNGWQAIQIVSPGAIKSNEATFSLTCP